MNQLVLAQARTADALLLAPRLRAADLAEIDAASGEQPEVALHRGIAASAEATTILHAGLPIAVFGVLDLGGGVGSPWLLGSDAVLVHWREFARRSRQVLDTIRPAWLELTNYVDARNTVHVRWLRWLGADLQGPYPHGRLGLPFHYFTL